MTGASAPSISVATLRDLVNTATERRPDLATKLERAVNLVVLRSIQPASRPGSWWVQSEADPTSEYLVARTEPAGTWVCLCQDFIKRGGPCKHALAVQLLRAALRREARLQAAMPRRPEPALACAPPLDVDRPIPYTLTPAGEAAADEPEPIVA
jgi:hypothetical protein